jgi:low affinity Fe/Cu permease
VTIAIQCLLGIWYASKLDSRVSRLEEARVDQVGHEAKQDRVMSETLSMLRFDIQELSRKIDRVTERQLDERKAR